MLVFNLTPVWAIEQPTPPPAPSAPPKPSLSQPTPPPAPPLPTLSEIPAPTAAPTLIPNPTPTPRQNDPQPTPTPTPNPFNTVGPGNQSETGNVGNTTITTGNSTNSANTTNLANTNSAAGPTSNGGLSATNTGNGTNSINNSSVDSFANQTTNQTNNANIGNNLNLGTVTGQNNASGNVGDSAIVSGNANTSGTIVNIANTNLSGISVSEFNVADNHTGDLVLDFAGNCILGCNAMGPTSLTNSGNGLGSQNNTTLNQATSNTTTQTNDTAVSNSLLLTANTGNNASNGNTGGDSKISTGNANVSGSALSFLNNNLAGQVVLGIVNIFGNLIGNIILPDAPATPASQQTLANDSNGANSTNNASLNQSNTSNILQSNTSNIQNDLVLGATTGGNQVNSNTGGDNTAQSGSANVESQTLNVTNTNVSDGNIWLVLVNKAGQWVGQILGAPTDASFAGSAGTDFKVSPSGEITVTNSGNGLGSQNNTTLNQASSNSTNQTNNAGLVNHLNLTANTGENSANGNTGGNSNITTGDAKVVANLVNFVNNNITGKGKLIVTIVNVFGSWFGNFVTPGAQSSDAPAALNRQDSSSSTGGAGSPQQTAASQQTPNQPRTISESGQTTPDSATSKTGASITSPQNPAVAFGQVLGQEFNRVFENNQPSIQVAGYKSTETGSSTNPSLLTKKKNIEINLAWLLIIVPAGFVTWKLLKRDVKIRRLKLP